MIRTCGSEIAVAAYSSGAIGRIVAGDAFGFIKCAQGASGSLADD
jgi:hypothetical protein